MKTFYNWLKFEETTAQYIQRAYVCVVEIAEVGLLKLLPAKLS